ncbi:MAG: LPS export ABC transporter ATP-binding protein [Planctomycetota bacterium]
MLTGWYRRSGSARIASVPPPRFPPPDRPQRHAVHRRPPRVSFIPSFGKAFVDLLQAGNLVKRYGQRTVVNDVSFNVRPSEIVGLLGRNGAGKTTSFRMTIGMITPDGGHVVFSGRDVTKLPMYRRANLGMGYLSQEPSILRRTTVEQNLMAFLELEALTRRERKARLESLLAQFDLAKTRKQLSSTLSGGERRKLEIARCLIKNPALILLDEPFSGVDPLAVEELQDEILRLRDEQGIAMLITDHNVQQTLRVVDRAYIMNEGRVLREGSPSQLIRDPVVRQSYLGSMFRGDEFDEQYVRATRAPETETPSVAPALPPTDAPVGSSGVTAEPVEQAHQQVDAARSRSAPKSPHDAGGGAPQNGGAFPAANLRPLKRPASPRTPQYTPGNDDDDDDHDHPPGTRAER